MLPLANYHPAMTAAQVAMVDHLVQGRLILGVGPGVPGDAEAIGDLGSDRNRKTQEALDHMCRICALPCDPFKALRYPKLKRPKSLAQSISR